MEHEELVELAKKVLVEKYDYDANETDSIKAATNEVCRVAASLVVDILWEYQEQVNKK